MKKLTFLPLAGLTIPFLILVSACSSTERRADPTETSNAGPAVLNERVEPMVIELTSEFRVKKELAVRANVNCVRGNVSNVMLQFTRLPIEVPMRHTVGSEWEGTLTPEQIELLAVSGKTMVYDATIVATDDQGRIGTSPNPIQIKIKAPQANS